jgi:ferric-dicitrate binding protein FerR (iron transport regulator)
VSLHDRKLDEVRRILAGSHPAVPADLAARAADQGRRLLRRRRTLHTALAILVLGALIAGFVLAAASWPATAPLPTAPAVD